MKKQTFLVSDESVNNYGFTVLTSGIDTTQFERNPIMLHMHKRPTIIGKWENLVKKDGKLYADAIFDIEDPIASEIAGKVERGFLKSASLGITFAPENKVDNVVMKSKLHEISIVDIGANDNALRLYKDEDFVSLNLKELTASSSLISLLNLQEDTTHKQIVDLVKGLKIENEDYKNKFATLQVEQRKEAELLIQMLVDRRLIKDSQKTLYADVFSQDFSKGKDLVKQMLPLKSISLFETIENHKLEKFNNSDSVKLKTEWDLEDYRKNAPKELSSNPELYKELLDKQFKN
jgi:hypothetical protein